METEAAASMLAPLTRFKSYYVVWKLQSYITTEKEKIGLNRTMQYGNPDGSVQVVASDGRFKSYYVVWKLSPVEFYD